MLNIQETKAEENKSSATVSDRTEEIDEASAIAEAKEEKRNGYRRKHHRKDFIVDL